MSTPKTVLSTDQKRLSDLYREYGVAWEKLLTALDLPGDIGIVKTMTLGQAKELAARHGSRKVSGSQEATCNTSAAPNVTSPKASQAEQGASSVLSVSDVASIEAAIREEIAAAQETVKTGWLDIDGIEHLTDAPGTFVYRLLLSSQLHFSPDQTVMFHTRKPKDTIQAVIVRSDDEGMVVECQKPLPTDAKFLNLSFDPIFILRALEKFVSDMAPSAGSIARLVVTKRIPTPGAVQQRSYLGLDFDQALAVDEMAATPLHCLWGPPGTGKTTTVGVAIVRWMRQNKRVLIVSTSNAAVDVAMKTVLKNARPEEKRYLLRLGTSLDSAVREITVSGKHANQNAALAKTVVNAQDRLRRIRELIQGRNLSHDHLHKLYEEAQTHEQQVKDFNENAALSVPHLTSDVLVMGCTLAKMVLDHELRSKSFDVVVLDEASMVSLLYAVAASFLASEHLVYAGDPKQLPPIVQAEGRNAAKWFGQNIYDWFGVEMGEDVQATRLSLLRTQYRMTNQIGSMVSRLSYSNLLKHGRKADGPKIEFIDIDAEWQTTHYSVSERSYYHFAAIPLLHALADYIEYDEFLFLSPFRPQRSLLAALAFDLRQADSERRISASTIHRAQGSEAKAVVVDLTTHSPLQLATFFKDKHCEKLFNVAMSRAKNRLVILGSRIMLRELSKTIPFWGRVLTECETAMKVLTCEEVICDLEQFADLAAVPLKGAKHLPAIYSHRPVLGPSHSGIDKLQNLEASHKLLVLTKKPSEVGPGDYIVRTSPTCPPVFVGGGAVCLPYRSKWVVVKSPNVSRVLWRIAFSHLAEDEIDPSQVRRFFCPVCSNGDLILRQDYGEGWFLICTNGQTHECRYRRRLSLEDAKLKVRLQGMRCSHGHPLTARIGSRGFFLGCVNYPHCKFGKELSALEGL